MCSEKLKGSCSEVVLSSHCAVSPLQGCRTEGNISLGAEVRIPTSGNPSFPEALLFFNNTDDIIFLLAAEWEIN